MVIKALTAKYILRLKRKVKEMVSFNQLSKLAGHLFKV
jgi:hypothetical protein